MVGRTGAGAWAEDFGIWTNILPRQGRIGVSIGGVRNDTTPWGDKGLGRFLGPTGPPLRCEKAWSFSEFVVSLSWLYVVEKIFLFEGRRLRPCLGVINVRLSLNGGLCSIDSLDFAQLPGRRR